MFGSQKGKDARHRSLFGKGVTEPEGFDPTETNIICGEFARCCIDISNTVESILIDGFTFCSKNP